MSNPFEATINEIIDKNMIITNDYKKLLKSLACLSEDTVKYVLRKLAKSEVF